MNLHPETEIVASSYDPITRIHSYTVQKGGKRYTAAIPDADFERFGPVLGANAATNKLNRRKHLASVVALALAGPADGE